MSKYTFLFLIALVAGGLVVIFLLGGGKAEVEEFPRIGNKIEELKASHLNSLSDKHEAYNSVPATSGAHLGTLPANDYNIYDQELKDETVLHGLEHGAVAIWYNSKTATKAELEQLKDTYNSFLKVANDRPKAYLIPRSDLDKNTKVALAAWGYLLKAEAIDGDQINRFYRGHLNKGPEQAP